MCSVRSVARSHVRCGILYRSMSRAFSFSLLLYIYIFYLSRPLLASFVRSCFSPAWCRALCTQQVHVRRAVRLSFRAAHMRDEESARERPQRLARPTMDSTIDASVPPMPRSSANGTRCTKGDGYPKLDTAPAEAAIHSSFVRYSCRMLLACVCTRLSGGSALLLLLLPLLSAGASTVSAVSLLLPALLPFVLLPPFGGG